MNIRFLAAVMVGVSMVACSNNTQKKPSDVKPVGDYFSIDGFIQSQLKQIQSQPYFVYKKAGTDLADSTVTNVQELAQFAQLFTLPELQNQKKYWYQEQNFGDKQNEEYTLNYTAQNDSALVKYSDVVFNDETNAVKRVYMQKMWQQADTSFEQKLHWKANKYLLLVTIKKTPHAAATAEQIKIVWNE